MYSVGRMAAAGGLVLCLAVTASVRADMVDMTGVEPWHLCGGCHGLDGAGNSVKFPRIAGQPEEYIIDQLQAFLNGRRRNDGGQMQATVTEIAEDDFPLVARWFAGQTPPWPDQTLEADADAPRIRQIAVHGVKGAPGCLSCHHAYPTEVGAEVVPRIAGQRDFYIAKQLMDYRDGKRGGVAMQLIAKELSDSDIGGLAVFLSRNPALHERSQ
jgi:cytochrome c553